MSIASIVFGVKIYLNGISISDADHGFYLTDRGTEWRLIQNDIVGLTGWTSGMISQGGLKKYTRKIDLKKGGNISDPGTGGVDLKNGDMLWLILNNYGVSLNECRVEIYQFTNITPIIQWCGMCQKPTWTAKLFSIPFVGFHEQRISNILTQINTTQFPNASQSLIGKTVPAALGLFEPVFNIDGTLAKKNFALLQRTADNVDDLYYDNAFFDYDQSNPGYNTFPVFDTNTPTAGVATTQFVDFNYFTFESVAGTFSYPTTTDAYLFVTEGDGIGQLKQIKELEHLTSGSVRAYLNDVFETPLWATADSGAHVQSWVQIKNVFREYQADTAPCVEFTDETAIQNLNAAPELWIPDGSGSFERIPQYGFTAPTEDTNNNRIKIASNFSNTDIDSIAGFATAPVTNIYRSIDATLKNWPIVSGNQWFLSNTYPGLYDKGPGWDYHSLVDIDYVNFNNLQNISDKNYATYGSLNISVQGTNPPAAWIKALLFTLPAPPLNFVFDKVYLGIRLTSQVAYGMQNNFSGQSSGMQIILRRLFLKNYQFMNSHTMNENTGLVTWDDLPDFYYVSNTPSTGSINFHIAGIDTSSAYGYTTFDLGITTIEQYNAIVEGGLFFSRATSVTGGGLDTTSIYDLCLIFHSAGGSISDKVYSPFMGRKFNSTFGGRKVATDLITKPNDMLEHISRLQNWKDTSAVPTFGWGLQYADGAVVNTVSFDNAAIPYTIGAIIDDYDSGYTDTLKRSLCRQFWLADWYNQSGAESVLRISKTMTVNSIATIQLVNIMDRSKIKVTEPAPQDLYTQPFINYNKNPDSGTFESQIQVLNTSQGAFSADYVTGMSFNTTLAKTIWSKCQQISLQTSIVTKPPTDLTDITWANGISGDDIASNHLLNWVDWQRVREVELPLHFLDAGNWAECTQFNLVLEHQTAGRVLNCLVEEIDINPNPPYDVRVKAIVLNNITTIPAFQDQIEVGAISWQDQTDVGSASYQYRGV